MANRSNCLLADRGDEMTNETDQPQGKVVTVFQAPGCCELRCYNRDHLRNLLCYPSILTTSTAPAYPFLGYSLRVIYLTIFTDQCPQLPCCDYPSAIRCISLTPLHSTPCPPYRRSWSSCPLSDSKTGHHLSLVPLPPSFALVHIPTHHHPLPTLTTSVKPLANNTPPLAHTYLSPPTTIDTIIPA
jgi:hypothetical protein